MAQSQHLHETNDRHMLAKAKAEKTYSRAYCEARKEQKEFFECASGQFHIYYWQNQVDVDQFDIAVDRVERVGSFFDQSIEVLDALGAEAEELDIILAQTGICPVCAGTGFYWMDEDAPRAICEVCK